MRLSILTTPRAGLDTEHRFDVRPVQFWSCKPNHSYIKKPETSHEHAPLNVSYTHSLLLLTVLQASLVKEGPLSTKDREDAIMKPEEPIKCTKPIQRHTDAHI